MPRRKTSLETRRGKTWPREMWEYAAMRRASSSRARSRSTSRHWCVSFASGELPKMPRARPGARGHEGARGSYCRPGCVKDFSRVKSAHEKEMRGMQGAGEGVASLREQLKPRLLGPQPECRRWGCMMLAGMEHGFTRCKVGQGRQN